MKFTPSNHPSTSLTVACGCCSPKRSRTEGLVLELGEVLGPHVGSGQHHVDVVGGQRCGPLRPVVDDLEGDVETFAGEDRPRLGLEAPVGDEPGHAAYPDVDADTDL